MTPPKNVESKEVKEEIKKLVSARLNVLPKDYNISMGSKGTFSRDELIEHVKMEDEVGEKIMQINMSFLQSLKTGEIYDFDNQAEL